MALCNWIKGVSCDNYDYALQGDDDDDTDDSDGDGKSPKKGRKQIRKIKGSKKLESSTKKAQKAEEERRKRVEEKQKKVRVIHRNYMFTKFSKGRTQHEG